MPYFFLFTSCQKQSRKISQKSLKCQESGISFVLCWTKISFISCAAVETQDYTAFAFWKHAGGGDLHTSIIRRLTGSFLLIFFLKACTLCGKVFVSFQKIKPEDGESMSPTADVEGLVVIQIINTMSMRNAAAAVESHLEIPTDVRISRTSVRCQSSTKQIPMLIMDIRRVIS